MCVSHNMRYIFVSIVYIRNLNLTFTKQTGRKKIIISPSFQSPTYLHVSLRTCTFQYLLSGFVFGVCYAFSRFQYVSIRMENVVLHSSTFDYV